MTVNYLYHTLKKSSLLNVTVHLLARLKIAQ